MSKSLIVLSGGKSKRMKMNKEMLKKDGEYIVIKNIRLYEQYFDDIVVVTNEPYFYSNEDVTTTSDVYMHKGPLAGIHAGLCKIKNEFAYVVACDMPYSDFNYIDFIYSIVDSNDIVVSKFNGYLEPFHALYSKKLIFDIEQLILNDQLAITKLLNKSKTRYVDYNNTSFRQNIFVNMNYKSDYLEYLEQRGLNEYAKAKKNIKSSK